MKRTKVIIALGGNALEEKGLPATAASQLEVVKQTVEYIADIIAAGYEVAIVHGNGPQVGRIHLASEAASDVTPSMPFDVCGAMSQGYIGYHIQQALKPAIAKRGIDLPVVSLVTQMVVDPSDPAFEHPTKPIGPFYSEKEALALADEKGYTVKEDSGRGWRRVVASPMPIKIVEIEPIKALWGKSVMVVSGGGGIPVVEQSDGSLAGVDAVIDKDFAAERLAEDLDADVLLILTEVEHASIYFRMSNEQKLKKLRVEEAERYIEEGHFAAGSMLPKMKASVAFAKSRKGRKAIIASLLKAGEAMEGRSGTAIEG
ncbi:MAG: carbamate kinase [Tissierellia bacterium]|nr:carbamate kinase [Bacillota bacterium]NLL23412.1 carbamate kinase [Tissierellia bacterium]